MDANPVWRRPPPPANVRGMLALALALAASHFAAPAAPAAAADTAAIVTRRQVLDVTVDPAAPRWTASVRAWLTVRRPVRRFALVLDGPVIERVEMNQRDGAVPTTFGPPVDGLLTIEADRPLVPGPAGLNVAVLGPWSGADRGFRRRAAGRFTLEHGAGSVIPDWPAGTAPPAWSVDVHVPAGCTVRSNLAHTETSRQGTWRAWTFVSRGPLPADSIRIEVVAPRARRR